MTDDRGQKFEFEMIKYRAEDRRLKSERLEDRDQV